MSEVDWDVRPDWATHYCTAHNSWRNDMIDTISDCCIPHPTKQEWTPERQAVKTLESMNYTYHGGEYWKPPLGEAPAYLQEWEGGLPPVGVECEAVHFDSWVPVEVVAHVRAIDGPKAVFQLVGFNEWSAYSDPSKFRPLKSHHERQRDELIALIGQQRPTIKELADAILSCYSLEPKQ